MNRTIFRAACLNKALAPAAAVAMLAGVANAQFVVENRSDTINESGDKSEQVIVVVENDQKTELRIENGKVVRAVVDGESWPADRVKMEGDTVVLLGPDGKRVRTVVFRVPRAPQAPVAPETTRRWVMRSPDSPAMVNPPPAPDAPMRWTVKSEKSPAPKVMLGINLSEPGDALRTQLGLGDKPAILIEGVIDDLPAAKGGVKTHDIVVSINGSDGASSETLSGLLAKAEPGDTVTLKVLRAGETKSIKVELAPYDAARLGVPAVPGIPGVPPVPGVFSGQGPEGGWMIENPEGQIEILIDRLAESPRDPELIDELRSLTSKLVRRLGRELQSDTEELSRELSTDRHLENLLRDTRNQFVELRNGRLFVRSAEEAEEQLNAMRRELNSRAPAMQEQLDARLRTMEERLESVERRLTDRMERLSDLMERLAERAEKAAGDKD